MREVKQMCLEEMKNVDVRTVRPETLGERSGVRIDQSLPRKERLKQFIRQVKNPYCYLDDGVVVNVSFAETNDTIEDRLEAYIRSM